MPMLVRELRCRQASALIGHLTTILAPLSEYAILEMQSCPVELSFCY